VCKSGRVAGRPSKLTSELQQGVVEILRNFGTRTAAAGRARIHYATFVDWMRRGERATSGKYYDFLIAVRDAESQAELVAWRTIRLKMVGGWYKVPTLDKDGKYVFRRDKMTGEILRDAQGRPEAEFSDEYSEPSAKVACWYLERRAREDFGPIAGEAATANVIPPPARPRPDKRETLNLFELMLKILADNGMKIPEPRLLEHEGEKAIETTARLEETPALNQSGVERMSDKDLENWVSYYVPQAGQAEKYEAISAAAKSFAQLVCECSPPSLEQRAAIRKIREAMYNASIACGGS
jgi:hypothetical protein